MTYYRVKPEVDGVRRCRYTATGKLACLTKSDYPYTYLIAGELFTEREMRLNGVYLTDVETVNVSRREVYTMFGARFAYWNAETAVVE